MQETAKTPPSKRVMKTIVCLVLCIALVFVWSYKEPVQVSADPVTVAVVGSVAIAAVATMLGIGIGAVITGESYTEMCQTVWEDVYKRQEDTIVFGEVGLAGELRSVSHIDARISEAAHLGFHKCVLPYHSLKQTNHAHPGIELVGVKNIRDAFEASVG